MDTIMNSGTMLLEKLAGWLEAIVLQLPNMVLAILIFGIAYFMVGFIKKVVRKITNRYTDSLTIVNLTTNVSAVIFSIIVALIILSVFNLDGTVNKFLATAGVVGLGIGLALQDPLQNLFSGVIMSVRSLYEIGDVVETNGHFGSIHNISLRSTILSTPQGQRVTIPNKDVITNPLVNYSFLGMRRLDLKCGISYGEDLAHVKEVALKAAKSIKDINEERPIQLFFTEFGDSSINFVLHLWCEYNAQKDYNEFRSNAIMALKAAFDEADIMIPYPIRTLDFNIKGGRPLKDELSTLPAKEQKEVQ